MRRKFHVRFLEEGERATALSYSAKAIIETITAARYRKGYGMLERYEAKVSRTVLRRGRASNHPLLFDSPPFIH